LNFFRYVLRTAEVLRAKIDWKSAFSKEIDQFGAKFHVQCVIPYQPFFRVKKLDDSVFHMV